MRVARAQRDVLCTLPDRPLLAEVAGLDPGLGAEVCPLPTPACARAFAMSARRPHSMRVTRVI